MDHFTGTKPVAAQHAMDVGALQTWLTQHVPGFEGPLSVQQFKGGQSNPTFRLDTPAKSYVMRSKPGPVAKLLPSAHAIEREFRVMKALAGSDVPVPAMHALCEDESVIGRAFYVMQHVEGRVLWDPTLPSLSPAERAAVYDEMNRVMAALHSVDVRAVGLVDYGKPGNYFERQISRWTKQYQASITVPNEPMDRLIAWLPSHIPASARDDSRVSIVHGDYRLDNLIFSAHEPKVLAVLDWELSTLGHPLADFSYHCMGWHIPPGAFRGFAGADIASLNIPSEDAYLRSYLERSQRGATPEQITHWQQAVRADWNFYLAYNLFRIAAIVQGIAKRVVDGTASSAQARDSGAAAVPLAALGWQYARQAGAS